MFTKNKLNELFNTINVDWTDYVTMYEYLKWIYSDGHLYTEFYPNNERLLAMLEKFIDFRIVGIIETNKKLYNDLLVDREPTKIYIILNNTDEELFLAPGVIIPQLWYKVNDINSIEQIINIFDPKKYSNEYECTIRYFLGRSNEYDDVDKIHDYFILNNFTEVLLYGSAWELFPEKIREHIKNIHIGPREYNKMCLYASKQKSEEFSISTHTLYSKSKIKFEDNNGIHIIQISYNPVVNETINIINKIKNTTYPNNIPIDLLLVLIQFGDLMTYKDILSTKGLNSETIESAISLAHFNEKAQLDIINILSEKRKFADNNTSSLLKKYCIFLSSNLEISKIIKSDKFADFIDTKVRDSNITFNEKVDIVIKEINKIGNFNNNNIIMNNISNMATYIVNIIS